MAEESESCVFNLQYSTTMNYSTPSEYFQSLFIWQNAYHRRRIDISSLGAEFPKNLTFSAPIDCAQKTKPLGIVFQFNLFWLAFFRFATYMSSTLLVLGRNHRDLTGSASHAQWTSQVFCNFAKKYLTWYNVMLSYPAHIVLR